MKTVQLANGKCPRIAGVFVRAVSFSESGADSVIARAQINTNPNVPAQPAGSEF